MSRMNLQQGQRVRIEQSINTREGRWRTAVEGEVVSVRSKSTGSWFAHGKHDKLWLQRLLLKRSDGELVEINLGEDARVTLL